MTTPPPTNPGKGRMPQRFPLTYSLPIVSVLLLQSCGDSTSPDVDELAMEISPAIIEMAASRDTTLELRNTGSGPIGPIELLDDAIRNSGGNVVEGPQLALSPRVIPTLNPGDVRVVSLSLTVPDDLPDDTYSFSIEARVTGVTSATISATVDVNFTVQDTLAVGVVTVNLTSAPPGTVRQGDPVRLTADARDGAGNVVSQAEIRWQVSPADVGFISPDGDFVGYAPGAALVIASAGSAADSVQVTVTARDRTGTFTIVGSGAVTERFTSDLWVHGTAAYTGTWGQRAFVGDRLNVWDVSDPSTPVITTSIAVDARTVNDVKISADGTFGVITHEGSNDLLNGITLMDLTDPLTPVIISRTTESLEAGVHNAWIDGDYVYLVVNGVSPSSGLRILDISDLSNPQTVASFYAGSSSLHDVYVRDGLAFLSHWNAGLVILDVGNGMAAGSPTSPVEVSRVATQGGQTHNAWYWPEGGYVFVGEEDFGTPGIMHVVDVTDLLNPQEVATFRVAGTTPHNFWMDEARSVLYLSWYTNGLQALDVSGQLLGELDRQGRHIAQFDYVNVAGGLSNSQNWAVQLHNGLLYLSDLAAGLWVLRPEF